MRLLPSPRLEKWRRRGCCEADDILVQVLEIRSRLALLEAVSSRDLAVAGV